jgi:hypothetical protein
MAIQQKRYLFFEHPEQKSVSLLISLRFHSLRAPEELILPKRTVLP